MKITNVQLSFTGLEAAPLGQKRMEGFLASTSTNSPLSSMYITTVNTIEHGHLPNMQGEAEKAINEIFFTCSRCGKRITHPLREGEDSETIRARRISEHDDHHFAQDLVRESGGTRLNADTPSAIAITGNKRKRKQEKPDSGKIANFFAKRA